MLNDPIVVQIQSCIQRIEIAVYNQSVIDEEYEQFCKVVQREMDEKPVHRTIKVKCGLSNKCRSIKKPDWNDRLTKLWNDLITTQRLLGRTRGTQKAHLTAEARGKQKHFDRVYQSAKHQYWHKMQNDILSLQGTNPKEYWKYVGKIGMGSVRKILILWEVTMEDGTVS